MKPTLPLLLAALLVPALPAQVVLRFPLAADASVEEGRPTTPLGTQPSLNIGMYFDGTKTRLGRAYVRFDLTSFPVAPVRATLLWHQSTASGAGCRVVTLHKAAASWSETTITWANQPGAAPASEGSLCVGDVFSPGWKAFDVTALVRQWKLGLSPNYGLVIRDEVESSFGAPRPGFGESREAVDPGLRPYLEISFVEPYGTSCAANGQPLPQLMDAGIPLRRGQGFVVTGTSLPAGMPCTLIVGGSRTQWGLLGLPLALTPFGFPGCTLLASNDLNFARTTTAGGYFGTTLSIPNNPALSGQHLYFQLAVADANLRLWFTNALDGVIW